MYKFYLFCDAGMSTSLMAARMKKVAEENKLPIEVEAYPQARMSEIIESENPSVVLLGPQVKHIESKVRQRYGDGRVVMVIDQNDYGTMNAERVLKSALLQLKKQRENE